MKKLICGAFAAALLGSAALPALAADLPSAKSAPVFAPIDDLFDPFLICVRALGVLPNGSGSTISGASIYGAKLTDNVVPKPTWLLLHEAHGRRSDQPPWFIQT